VTREELNEVMDGKSDLSRFKDRNTALLGLNLIARYLPKSGVEAANHDVIYSVSVDELLEAGLTKEDAKELRDMNWMIEEDHFACFV